MNNLSKVMPIQEFLLMVLEGEYKRLSVLSYGQDPIHAEKWCVEMCDFCMAALMFHTGHEIKARILAQLFSQ